MAIFPLRFRPQASYKERPRSFGSPRDGGKRRHAGCDLYAPAGADVLAVEDGQVIRGPYLFYDVVFAVEILHTSGIVVRYSEISKELAPGIHAGAQVKQGQAIGKVGKMVHVAQPMLHFELFSGQGQGPLTDRAGPPYARRSDLLDPTAFLDACLLPVQG